MSLIYNIVFLFVVSIPKGSIKSKHILIKCVFFIQFQFQKVRLKAQASKLAKWFKMFQFQKVRLKVSPCIALLICSIGFQFQKVRLKVVSFILFSFLVVVSIPKGSIKRKFFNFHFYRFLLFQFQKVRLKGYGWRDTYHPLSGFNSKRFD